MPLFCDTISALIVGQRIMTPADAPPGFWPWDATEKLVTGVELESSVPTRFFQTVGAYPLEWGRLYWRVQLNNISGGRGVTTPVFRTFYPGVEWNLKHPKPQWFLTAWLRWEGPGPPQHIAQPPSIEGATVTFHVDRSAFLRCRVDARDRRSMARSVLPPSGGAQADEPGLISLDDIIEPSH